MRKSSILFVLGYLSALLATAALVSLLWKGGWQVSTEALRLDYLGKALLSFVGLAALFGGGILIAGPLRNISIKAGPVECSIDGDDDASSYQ